jgi:hypothetical protein
MLSSGAYQCNVHAGDDLHIQIHMQRDVAIRTHSGLIRVIRVIRVFA